MTILQKFVVTKPALVIVIGALLLAAAAAFASNQFFGKRGTDATNWYVVKTRSISKPLFLNGILVSKRTQSIAPPYDTRLTEINIVSGQHVLAGDKLVSFDSQAVELELLDAKAKLSAAQQELVEIQNWQSSSAVAAATRDIESAERRERLLVQKTGKSESLHRQGIISTDELNEIKTQLSDQQSETLSKREGLADLLASGKGAKLQFAEIKYKTARQVVELLERELSETNVVASFDGIVFQKTSAGSSADDVTLYPGDAVAANKDLFFIANTRQLMVTAVVNEMDINHLNEGKAVEISSDAIPGAVFNGYISRLSARASRGSGDGDTVPTFDVYAELQELTDAQASDVRLNVSVTVKVEVYRSDDSIVIPIQSLQFIDDTPMVTVADGFGNERQQKVEIGVITEQLVEIVSGLNVGDRVAVDAEFLSLLSAETDSVPSCLVDGASAGARC